MTTAVCDDVFSISAVMAHVDHMQKHYPYRKSGLGQDLAAANYVVAQMRSFGLEAELEEFDAYDSDPGTATLELLGENGCSINTVCCTHAESTPEGGYIASLIDVGAGGLEDYAGKDVTGKIVLAEVSYAPATPEKARIAASKGAAGIILMNWGQDDGSEIPSRGLKAVWGNPTPETWNDIPRLFGVSISRRDGIALRAKLRERALEVRITTSVDRVWRKLHQPIAWLHAPETAPQRDQFLIISGHIDSWNPGVTDNLTGNSTMLEIARGMAKHRDLLKRSLVFCFWNGHEVAEATGSTCFVDKHWERINRDAVAYFNIDSVGMKGSTEFHINACPELQTFSSSIAKECFGDQLPIETTDMRRVGDQSFFGVGVSAVTGRHMYAKDVIERENGATLGWYNHTEFDTMDVVDADILANDLKWCGRFVAAITTTDVLPHNMADRLRNLRVRFEAALDDCADIADLGRLLTYVDLLESDIKWLDAFMKAARAKASEKQARKANQLLLRLSRLLTFLTSSASGKYEQDSYGISTLLQPVPRLADLAAYKELDPESTEARLLLTQLIRRRHEIGDALCAARELVADFRAYIEVAK